MKRLHFATLFFVLLLIACSWSSDFFIINQSDSVIDVEYKVKVYPTNPVLYTVPAKIPVSQVDRLDKPGHQLEKLGSDQYQFDKESGVVKVQLMPNEALWITDFPGYSRYDERDVKYFFIQEISIKGAEGEIKYTDPRQTLRAFSKASDTVFELVYR